MESDYPGKAHFYCACSCVRGRAARARPPRRGLTQAVAQTRAAFSGAALRDLEKERKEFFALRQKRCYDCRLS